MNKKVKLAFTVLATASLGGMAQAGQVLRFQSGNVNTQQMLQKFHAAGVVAVAPTSYYVVQFKSKVTKQDRTELQNSGAKIFNYIPDDALLVQISSSEVNKLQALAGIQAVLPFETKWRISPALGNVNPFNQTKVTDLDVTLTSSSQMKPVLAKLAALKQVQILHSQGTVVTLKAPLGLLNSVAALDGVLWVQKPTLMKLADMPMATEDIPPNQNGDFSDLTGTESGQEVINMNAAWKRGYNGAGQVVAMADTGLDTGDQSTLWTDFTSNLGDAQVFGLYSNGWGDPMGHGTHVAGSIYSNGSGSNGLTRGGAYGASFVVQSMWSTRYKNLTVPPDLGQLFQSAYDDGARIHSDSWGSESSAYDATAAQVDNFMWQHPDMLIVIAAGNGGQDKQGTGRVAPGSVGAPATAKDCLTVGASKGLVRNGGIQVPLNQLPIGPKMWPAEPLASEYMSDNPNGLAPFSSRGPTADGRLEPDVVAPGTNVLSDCSHYPGASPLWGHYNADYCFSGGTSMSTPITAGAATALRQYLVDGLGMQDPSAALIKNILMNTATDLYPGQFGAVGANQGQEILHPRPDNNEGFGRVNMDQATDLSQYTLVDNQNGIQTGDQKVYSVNFAGGTFTATMVYTDAPAAPNSSQALVNDLDLEVQTPDGQVIAPKDRINNEEMVEIPNAPAGQYAIGIVGYNVPQGPQPYSLVVNAPQQQNQ